MKKYFKKPFDIALNVFTDLLFIWIYFYDNLTILGLLIKVAGCVVVYVNSILLQRYSRIVRWMYDDDEE